MEAGGFGDAEDLTDLAAFDDFAGIVALAVEPRHEVFEADFVFGFGFEDENFDGAEAVGGDAAAFEFQCAGNGFKKRGGLHLDGVRATFDVGERDAAKAFGHGEGEVSIFAFCSL